MARDPMRKKPGTDRPEIWVSGGQRPPFDIRALGRASLHLSREGLVHATRTAMTRAGRAVAAGFELMFELGNDIDRAKRGTVTIEWEPPDPSSILDQAQAAMNAKAAGMSIDQALEYKRLEILRDMPGNAINLNVDTK